MHDGDLTPTSTTAMAERWEQIAPSVAERPATRRSGELTVIGSGMAHVDFTMDAEPLIRSADVVLHCLYDRISQIWINQLRPDALDLRILYRADVDRYVTYVQMAEVMLYHVRLGKKVVAVYYGHPGIFATPTHRAIKIARREGHRAIMRPGISALDYLIADVGVDPMLPGLSSFEASDLLLRRRTIDPSLHVILWQVGVVGEFQFAPDGFANAGFDLLAEELERVYGASWELVHYIAPQYVGVEPLIDRHAMGSLRDLEVRSRFSSLSTFYIPPLTAVATDAERSAALGFTSSGAPTEIAERDYDIASYGPREIDAVQALRAFTAPAHYALPAPSPAAEFMLALSRELELQALYRADPARALNDPRFAHLSDRARELLTIPHPLAINAAIAEPPRGLVED